MYRLVRKALLFAVLSAMLFAIAPAQAAENSHPSVLATLSPFRTATRLRLGDQLPSTRFVDQAGKTFTFADWRDKYIVLAFIYTRCKDARECPLTSAKFGQLQTRLGDDSRLAEVTIDPEYDRPNIFATYAKTYHFHRVELLTGDPNAVMDFAAALGVSAFKDPTYGFIHDESTVIADPHGKIVEMITESSWSPDEIVSVIAHDEHRPSNPIARLDLALSEAAVAVCGNSVSGFSGLLDLAVVLIIVVAGGWIVFRVARTIARGST
jgi:cytochrome oxidase Cu insertion factor (SCO1/SenC/PrrC family)